MTRVMNILDKTVKKAIPEKDELLEAGILPPGWENLDQHTQSAIYRLQQGFWLLKEDIRRIKEGKPSNIQDDLVRADLTQELVSEIGATKSKIETLRIIVKAVDFDVIPENVKPKMFEWMNKKLSDIQDIENEDLSSLESQELEFTTISLIKKLQNINYNIARLRFSWVLM